MPELVLLALPVAGTDDAQNRISVDLPPGPYRKYPGLGAARAAGCAGESCAGCEKARSRDSEAVAGAVGAAGVMAATVAGRTAAPGVRRRCHIEPCHGMGSGEKLTDNVFTAVPGELDVALAVHGGNQVHPSRRSCRMPARCGRWRQKYAAGPATQSCWTFWREPEERAGVVVYIGDVFEELPHKAMQLARLLKQNETRVIILHDLTARDFDDGEVFHAIAEITGGAVLPFDHSSADERLGELLEAVAVLGSAIPSCSKKSGEQCRRPGCSWNIWDASGSGSNGREP